MSHSQKLPERNQSADVKETEELAARFGRELQPGDVVLLAGDLGTGKTTFVQGACKELGVTDPVTSPSFMLANVYQGKTRIAHLDLYRLGKIGQEEWGMLSDYIGPEIITFIEWPASIESNLEEVTYRVMLTHLGGDKRSIEIISME